MQKVIRLTKYEKKNIPKNAKYLTLFYYKHTTVKKGEIYTVPTILRFGKRIVDEMRNQVDEILPRLSYKNIFSVECLEVKNNIQYDDLPENIFKYSLDNIKDKKSLQKSIIRKYKISRPHLTKQNILEDGVAYTVLKIIVDK